MGQAVSESGVVLSLRATLGYTGFSGLSHSATEEPFA